MAAGGVSGLNDDIILSCFGFLITETLGSLCMGGQLFSK